MDDPRNTFLTGPQLDDRWRRRPGYSVELRAQGKGPRFVRLSDRVLVYRLSDVIEYEERNTFASNAEELMADGNSPEAA